LDTVPHHQFVRISAYPVFKLHGSTDWASWLPDELGIYSKGTVTDEDVIRSAPLSLESPRIRKKDEPPPRSPNIRFQELPALAIPTLSKSSLVCPPAHADALREFVKRVDKIAIIGWRAGEKQFLEILANGLRPGVDVIAACGNERAASETINNLKNAGVPLGRTTQSLSGFTDFVLNRGINWLLEQPASQSPP
jgi:hypothetical protein